MKKISNFLLVILFATATVFTSCKKDNDDNPGVTLAETTFTDGTDAATSKASITIKDGGKGVGTMTFKKDKVYVLDGLVFVNDGQTLTIEPGTVIKGKPGTGEQASALVVARGGKIMAEGTKTEPIIFTYEGDDLKGIKKEEAKWGGLIVLGKAQLNSAGNESAIEGISTSETRGLYGGNIDTDNSGSIKYVSIRNGGSDIGADNEINGLTLGGVGSGTTIEHVEIFYNKDDGVEFFGGTVGIKYLVVGLCGDDAVDYDEGYRGENKFIFIYQGDDRGDRGGEHDGGTKPETGEPYAKPKFWNVTSIGNADNKALTFRDNAGGYYYNSVFAFYKQGAEIELLKEGECSKKRWDAGDLSIENCTFVQVGGTGTSADKLLKVGTEDKQKKPEKIPAQADIDAFQTVLTNAFTTKKNEVKDNFISKTNPTPSTKDTDVKTGGPANYRGAFDTSVETSWITWTTLYSGYFAAR